MACMFQISHKQQNMRSAGSIGEFLFLRNILCPGFPNTTPEYAFKESNVDF